MISPICKIFFKINNKTKQKQTHLGREQIGCDQRGRGMDGGQNAKGSQLHGDGWKLDFWW